MANVRDSDTSLWLHNKLGTSNDSWTGGSICTQLNEEVLRNIKDCFPDLQTQVKLKLLLSFFHIPRRNVEKWCRSLEEIMEVASLDSEMWVSMLAEVMKTLPSTGSLNTQQLAELDEARPAFGDMVAELRRLVTRHAELPMLPLECHYLNKAALVSVVGAQPAPIKHFTLKRKPKSAALRAELLQKSSDALSSNKKTPAPMVPVRSRGMPRKMNDTTPLKGLPSRIGARVVRPGGAAPPPPPAAPRKDGGIKLLDIADQPATHTQKKRKRLQELEEQQKKAALEAESSPVVSANAAATAGGAAATAAGTAGGAGALPEYARGLNNYTMPSTPNTEQAAAVSAVSAVPRQEGVLPPTAPAPAPAAPLAPPAEPPPLLLSLQPKPVMLPQKLLITGQPGQKPLLVTAGPGGTLLSGQGILKTATGVPVILTNSSLLQHNTNKTVVLTSVKQVSGGTPNSVQILQPSNASNLVLSTAAPTQGQGQPTTAATSTPATTANNTTQPPNLLPRRGLSLTREQMLEAQDMFRNANRVTRPEKALILGFMAGSRDNPCPNLGNIVTIKLSENQENVLQKDSTYLTMMCETHFQMNYNNGQWMRIKKYRPIEGATPQPQMQQVS